MNSTTAAPVTRRRFLGTAAAAATGAAAGGVASGVYFHHRARQQAAEFLSGQFFDDPTFDFTTRSALGASYYGCANPGKIFAITSRIADGDFESAYRAFYAAGDEAKQWGEEAASQNHRVSAREAYLWAASYYYAALYFLDGTADPTRLLPTWKQYASCWAAAAALFTPAVERVEIPYANTALTGWLFRASDSKARRPLVILNTGSDGSELGLLVRGGAGGMARGYNCLAFNGPGQGDALWLKKLCFRPDWEKVVTPVVDFALAYPEVDAKRIALVGVSQGGYMVPRALAFEHRIAAGVADPGTWNVADPWTRNLPQSLIKLLDAGNKEKFDSEVGLGLRFRRRSRITMAFRMRPYGFTSYYDVFHALRQYNLKDVAGQIRCPMLITNPESEPFFPGQSRELYDMLHCPKTLLDFTAEQGAGLHCEVDAPGYRDFRIYKWLDETLGNASS
ncbi:MAG: twin-arginine translocation signal domain-containing protein [Terriglobia bacterium]